MTSENENITPRVYNISFTFSSSIPENVTIDIGFNGTTSHRLDGILENSTRVVFDISKLSDYLNTTCDYPTCDVPIMVSSDTISHIKLEELEFVWTDWNWLDMDYDGQSTDLAANGSVFAYFDFDGGQLQIKPDARYEGNHDVQFRLHAPDIPTFFKDSTAHVYTSFFNLYMRFEFWLVTGIVSLTQKNITPINGNPFFNIDPLYSGHTADFYVKLNESIHPCVEIMFDNDTDPSGAYLMNTSAWQPFAVNASGSSANVNLSTWVNLNCTNQNLTEINPYFCFIPLCTGCVKTYDWEVCYP